MSTVLPTQDLLLPPPSRTVRFDGEDLRADVAFFVADLDPGGGPAQHRHPDAEVFLHCPAQRLFMSGDERREAAPGEVIGAGPEADHGFTCVRPERLRMVCIHATAGWSPSGWTQGLRLSRRFLGAGSDPAIAPGRQPDLTGLAGEGFVIRIGEHLRRAGSHLDTAEVDRHRRIHEIVE
jgi:quercetin dioxygenase-like cupin family protein